MLLQTKGQMTAQQLGETLEVSTRTIYRDLDALSTAGVPVYAERGPSGGCMLLESYRTNLTGLNENEVRALFMFTVPGLVADLGVEKEAEAALRKLTAALPLPFQQDAAAVQQRLHLDPEPWFQPAEPVPYLRLLQDAIWTERRVRMQYRRGDGQWVKRLIDPYGLVAKASTWYVVAGGQFTQVFRVSRVMEAEMTNGRFTRPTNFNLQTFWQSWSERVEQQREKVSVTLAVSPAGVLPLSHLLGDAIHPLVAAAPSDDHGRLHLTLSFASLEEAGQRLMGLGTAVDILHPPTLRHHLHHLATQLVQQYANTP
ncbi:MAG: WYL domain-containing protein [Ardenticatenaceae bacterium]|nr:WYL domain-containing protein [Ardenticatenaceae bacterium]